jgi:hypothetical protein
MKNFIEFKAELEKLRQNNAPLHNKYVSFTVETPDKTYNLTMSFDKFLEYIDRAVVFDKTAAEMLIDEKELYQALIWERFISNLKANFNEFAQSDGIYRCEITDLKELSEFPPEIGLMSELVMGEYAAAVYEDRGQAVKRLEKSVNEDSISDCELYSIEENELERRYSDGG